MSDGLWTDNTWSTEKIDTFFVVSHLRPLQRSFSLVTILTLDNETLYFSHTVAILIARAVFDSSASEILNIIASVHDGKSSMGGYC
jgi:hypothetical protein